MTAIMLQADVRTPDTLVRRHGVSGVILLRSAMKYVYKCPNGCKPVGENVIQDTDCFVRNVLARERKEQRCKQCGALLERDMAIEIHSTQIRVPTYFRSDNDFNDGDSVLPTSAESRKTWEECDVRPKRGSKWL